MLREVLAKGLPDGMTVEPVAAAVMRIAAAGRAAWPAVELTEDALAERIASR